MNFALSNIKITKTWSQTIISNPYDVIFGIDKIAHISFLINKDEQFILEIFRKDGNWFPNKILHNGKCPFCESNLHVGNECCYLENFIHEIGDNIINEKTIRIRLFF